MVLIRFQLLGYVAARSDRGVVPLGSARQRTVLAALLVEPGVPVSVDQLVERVWGATPPRSARRTLHSYVSRLRSVLADEGGPVLGRRNGGYALEVDESAVDLHRFRALVAQARSADDGRAAALWQASTALWQGQPFADLDSDWARSVAGTLEAERLAATLEYSDLLLRSGAHAQLLPEVAEAAEAHPLDERVAGQLMLALYRCGRQADALAHYRQLQERLADELGSDPGPELRELHQRILRHDPDLAAPTVSSADAADDLSVAPGRPHRPAQLPLDVADFTGRSDDLRRLDLLLSDATEDGAMPAVVIAAIGGTAGVGKTALAVHWAHRVADRFPDGQLYVNLRGYDPEQPMRPSDALAQFLAALGVAERAIPTDGDQRAARYRSELADRRMLIVLDNVSSVSQVRPLLPGSGASMVVVTSRDSLAGLVAVHGARQVGLDLLPDVEAVDLLHRLIGERVVAEPEAAVMLAEQCARLPLALRVAAVLATSRPDLSLADVVAELADRQERLELLDPGGDPYAAVHAVFSWSIQHLPEPVARTFRRLGLHPGPDLDPYVAAALTGMEPDGARRVLETLVSAHLLHRTGSGRYGMHDLLRAYAARLTATEDTREEQEAAEDRLFAYYQDAAVVAMETLRPKEAIYRPDPSALGVSIPGMSAPAAARSWLAAERFCILAIVERAADTGRFGYAVSLARVMYLYLVGTHLTDVLEINGHALRAAERAGDQAGQAHALRQLSLGHTWLGQYETAIEYKWRALALFRQVRDLVGESGALTDLGSLNFVRGDHKSAVDNHRHAIALSRQAGERRSEAIALTNLGIAQGRLGDNAAAIETQCEALEIVREIGARHSEAITLNNLANVEMRLERYASAGDHLRQAVEIMEDLGSYSLRAHTLNTRGVLHLRLEQPDLAVDCFQRALAAFRETGERVCQAVSTNGLGEVAQFTGALASALSLHTEALALATEDGSRHQQARAHAGLGHAHRGLGDLGQARTHYEHAYALYTELDMPEAEGMRAQLETAPPMPVA